jgi:hypothetical protein
LALAGIAEEPSIPALRRLFARRGTYMPKTVIAAGYMICQAIYKKERTKAGKTNTYRNLE